MENEMNGLIKSVIKTSQIIDLINKNKQVSLKVLTIESGIPKPTVHRILATLIKIGYVQFDSKVQLYSLGAHLIHIARNAVAGMTTVDLAKPRMQTLRERFNETVNLARLVNDKAVFVHIEETKHAFRYVDHIGDQADLHSTAVGKVIFAFMDQADLDIILNDYTFTTYTKNTIRNRAELDVQLTKIRKQAFALDDEEGTEGVTCLAVPIFNADNRIAGALSISIPKTRVTKKMILEVEQELPKAGTRLSLDLGVTDIRKCYTVKDTSS
jgi:IclR family transcriptional regulator, KDG regulon repressor